MMGTMSGDVVRCLVEISRSELMFVCESEMTISWIWCANDVRYHHGVG